MGDVGGAAIDSPAGGYIPTHDAAGRELSNKEVLAMAEHIVGRTLRLLNAPSENCLTATEVANGVKQGDTVRVMLVTRCAEQKSKDGSTFNANRTKVYHIAKIPDYPQEAQVF